MSALFTQQDTYDVWERYVDKRLKRKKQGLRPCFICGKPVDGHEYKCYGCGKVICNHEKHWQRASNGLVSGMHNWEDHGKRWKRTKVKK